MKKIKSVCLILFLTAGSLLADVKLSNVFSDNMVLQREMKVPVWGRADAGKSVAVNFNGQRVSVITPENGKWRLDLFPMKASTTPMSMTVQGKNTITVTNILIGDVWICTGQSNMALTLEKDNRAGGIESDELDGVSIRGQSECGVAGGAGAEFVPAGGCRYRWSDDAAPHAPEVRQPTNSGKGRTRMRPFPYFALTERQNREENRRVGSRVRREGGVKVRMNVCKDEDVQPDKM